MHYLTNFRRQRHAVFRGYHLTRIVNVFALPSETSQYPPHHAGIAAGCVGFCFYEIVATRLDRLGWNFGETQTRPGAKRVMSANDRKAAESQRGGIGTGGGCVCLRGGAMARVDMERGYGSALAK